MGRERSPLPPDCTGLGWFSHPLGGTGRFSLEKGGELPESSVAEIHGYPRRPPGFEEPLFPTQESKRRIMAHFLEAPWLSRASELPRGVGETAHAARDRAGTGLAARAPPGFLRPLAGWVPSRRRVVRVLERWREVRAWWDEETRTDRFAFRVLLVGGAVAELALERSGGWFLVGVAD